MARSAFTLHNTHQITRTQAPGEHPDWAGQHVRHPCQNSDCDTFPSAALQSQFAAVSTRSSGGGRCDVQSEIGVSIHKCRLAMLARLQSRPRRQRVQTPGFRSLTSHVFTGVHCHDIWLANVHEVEEWKSFLHETSLICTAHQWDIHPKQSILQHNAIMRQLRDRRAIRGYEVTSTKL